jgi:hypothetical protein
MTPRAISVEAYAGYRGGERPLSFTVNGKRIEVRALLRSWLERSAGGGQPRRVFTLRGSDGAVHTIFLDEASGQWYSQ